MVQSYGYHIVTQFFPRNPYLTINVSTCFPANHMFPDFSTIIPAF